MSNSDTLYSSIGKIIINLQSLEFALRLFLYETVGPEDKSFQVSKLSVGVRVPETHLTNYDTMGTLIEKVNNQLKILKRNDQIDESLTDLRDSIAHGRALSLIPNGIPKLFKFKRPINGFAEVNTLEDLTPQWLSLQIKRIHKEVQKVAHISQELGLSCFPK